MCSHLKWKKNGVQCLSILKIEDVLFELEEELRLDLDFNTWLPDDDSVILGFQMFEALLYCQDHQDEAKRLSLFFDSLLTDQSLCTVLSATFNNLEARRGNDIQDYTAVNMWHNFLYKELDARYNFSFGSSVIALSTTEQLQELAKLKPPNLLKETTSEELDLSGQYKRLIKNSV